jgi:orotidine-5'-phosphate decarboxylase
VAFAKEKGMVVIGDIKRGDIGSTAEAYAAHISPVDIFGVPTDIWREDFITVSAYMGMDSLEPFARKAEETGKGIFVLVKTSNPGGADVQDLAIQDADAVNEILLYERVGKLAELAGARLIGKCGYSSVGAVVGATHEKEGARLRDLLPRTFFLVPGFGAQGASAEGLRGFFDVNGGGAAVNSSRGITCAWKELPLSPEEIDADALAVAVRSAAVAMKGSLESVLGQ